MPALLGNRDSKTAQMEIQKAMIVDVDQYWWILGYTVGIPYIINRAGII